MAQTFRTIGIVLRRRSFRQVDKLVTVYTPMHGKLRLIAKGALKIESKLAGHLEPFMRSEFLVARGKEWFRVAGVQVEESFLSIRSDLEKLAMAVRWGDRIDTFTRESAPDERVFHLLNEALETLQQSGKTEANQAVMDLAFTMKLLMLIGIQPELRVCVICRAAILEHDHAWSPRLGGLVHPAHVPRGVPVQPIRSIDVRALRFLQSESFRRAQQLRLPEHHHQELSTLIADWFAYHTEARV
jgi:DNA repair protein RecO (recombination protein O)